MSRILIHTVAFNRVDLLKKTLESILSSNMSSTDYYDILIHVVTKDAEIDEYLASIIDKSITLKVIGYNVGVAYCFNDALQNAFEYNKFPYDGVLFINSDIELAPDDLNKMFDAHKNHRDKLITVCGTHGKHKDWTEKNLSHGMACALLPKTIFDEVGYFDENLFPAYLEDCDYFTRLWLSRGQEQIRGGYDKISAKDSPIVHCITNTNTHHEGSSVIYSNSTMYRLNQKTHAGNNKYYVAKWGGLNDYETYIYPFDKDGLEAEVGFKITLDCRHDPYPDFWNRDKEKKKYYDEICALL